MNYKPLRHIRKRQKKKIKKGRKTKVGEEGIGL